MSPVMKIGFSAKQEQQNQRQKRISSRRSVGDVMQARTLFALFLIPCFFVAPSVHADQILKWVDAKGVVQFGSPNVAPHQGARVVKVQPVNGMDAPDVNILDVAPSTVSVAAIARPHVTNKTGWRGKGYDSQRKGQGRH
jgi:Domain of unknown function (DUF4124)